MRFQFLLYGLCVLVVCWIVFQWWWLRDKFPATQMTGSNIPKSAVFQAPDPTVQKEPLPYEVEVGHRERMWDAEHLLSGFEDLPSCGTYQLIILVMSPPYNFERRDAIRKSWASPKNDNTTSWRTLFVVGDSETEAMDILLENEQEKHKDLIRADMTDSYRNLTMKVMLGITIASRLCRFKYLMKTDDDCYVNSRVMTEYLITINKKTRLLYTGRLQKNTNVIRDNKSKWSVDDASYSFSHYPPYISGAGYILSQDVVNRLLNVYSHVPIVPSEDAYMGVLMAKLGVTPLPSGRFSLVMYNLQPCNLRYLFLIHGVKPRQQVYLHKLAEDRSIVCQYDSDMLEW